MTELHGLLLPFPGSVAVELCQTELLYVQYVAAVDHDGGGLSDAPALGEVNILLNQLLLTLAPRLKTRMIILHPRLRIDTRGPTLHIQLRLAVADFDDAAYLRSRGHGGLVIRLVVDRIGMPFVVGTALVVQRLLLWTLNHSESCRFVVLI